MSNSFPASCYRAGVKPCWNLTLITTVWWQLCKVPVGSVLLCTNVYLCCTSHFVFGLFSHQADGRHRFLLLCMHSAMYMHFLLFKLFGKESLARGGACCCLHYRCCWQSAGITFEVGGLHPAQAESSTIPILNGYAPAVIRVALPAALSHTPRHTAVSPLTWAGPVSVWVPLQPEDCSGLPLCLPERLCRIKPVSCSALSYYKTNFQR